jgi:hypothetical protein
MDAYKFFKERERMMEARNCPSNCHGEMCDGKCLMWHNGFSFEQAINYVEKWSKENPIKTNAQKFQEVFGVEIRNAKHLDKDGRAFVIETLFPGRVANESWLNEEYREKKHE